MRNDSVKPAKGKPLKKREKTLLAFVLLLLFTLPFLVWAIVTQTFELRQKAQESIVCWNKAIRDGNKMFWPDSCRGAPPGDAISCAEALIEFTIDEYLGFNRWAEAQCRPAIVCSGYTQTFPCEQVPVPEGNYELEPHPSREITMAVSPPNTGFGIFALLRLNGQVVTDQTNITYTWSVDDPSVATIGPFAPNPAPGEPCDTYGIQQPCPQNHALIHALKVGSTVIHAAAYQESPGDGPSILLASTTFNLTVTLGESHDLKFRVKLVGVAGGEAGGAKMTIQFTNSNLNLFVLPVPTLTHIGNGTYEANITVSEDQLPAGSGYKVIVKGEKHLAKKFCFQTGQTNPCTNPSDNITINYATNPLIFDFTGRQLDPGDIPNENGLQNYAADQEDFERIITQMSQPCFTTTVPYRNADLNYSGCVNVIDGGLMRNTLSSQYDEN